MTNICRIAVAAVALAAGTVAQATILRFDGLVQKYGDGAPLGLRMTGNGQYLAYSEAGYVLTLHTNNAPDTLTGAHIGDVGFFPDTFNWHDQGNNLAGAYVELTRADGRRFDLFSFGYIHVGTDMTVVAAGPYLPLRVTESSGVVASRFYDVPSVTFSSSDNSYNMLDNLWLSVPEPASWGLMIVGFGLVGAAARRRQALGTA